MKLGHGAAGCDSPSDVLNGDLAPAHLEGDKSEPVPRIGMIRLGGENLPINLLGHLQLAGLVIPGRYRQCLENGRHSYARRIRQAEVILRLQLGD